MEKTAGQRNLNPSSLFSGNKKGFLQKQESRCIIYLEDDRNKFRLPSVKFEIRKI